jgi:hypothetical protein
LPVMEAWPVSISPARRLLLLKGDEILL